MPRRKSLWRRQSNESILSATKVNAPDFPMTPCFYINLDRVPERRAFMEEQAERAGLGSDLHRLPATDGAMGCVIAEYKPHSWGPRWELTPSEVAVFDSHRRAWRAGLDRDAGPFVVCEDDLRLSSMFGKGLASALAVAKDGDVIKLDGVFHPRRYGPPVPTGPASAVRSILQTAPSAACYLVTPGAAAKMLKASDTFCDHLDDFVFDPSATWQIWQLDPAIAVQSTFSAAHTEDGVAGISERTQSEAAKARGPALYRGLKEMRRSLQRIYRVTIGDRTLLATGGFIGAVPLAADLGAYRSAAE